MAAEVQKDESRAKTRPRREKLPNMVKRREIDTTPIWKLDCFDRSLAALVMILNELQEIGLLFVSLMEFADFSISSGRATTEMFSTFAGFESYIFCERVKAGIASAREEGKPHGRPKTAAIKLVSS